MKLGDYTVALVGCGKMGGALLLGAVEAGAVDTSKLVLIDRDSERARKLGARLGTGMISDQVDAEAHPVIWVMAVKPHDLEGALEEQPVEPGDVVVSVAAGVAVASIRETVGPEITIVRTMPNTPSLVRRGVTGVYCDTDAEIDVVVELFESVGAVVRLDREAQFDALTALSGSGPAYLFVAMEALADGAVQQGMSRDVARELAIHTVAGAAALALETGEHFAELKDAVASPGGTTIEALATLEHHGFRSALIAAVEAAAQRSRAMGSE